MKTVVVIPARMNSERLPGKPLMQIRGISIINLCYYNSFLSFADKEVYVASADVDILWEVTKNKGNVIETSDKPVNGTERIAEAARILQLAPDDIVVNLQGDMPFFNPEIIDEPVKKMKAIPECNVASIMTMLKSGDKDNPNRVKVTTDSQGRALSFSREDGDFLHIGVYVFRNWFLQEYDKYGIVAEERMTHLEQQRIMHMKEFIWMSFVESRPVVIDTKEDLVNAQNS